MWADNGKDSDLFHADNDNSSTRFRLTGAQEVMDGLKLGVIWESQFESNTSASLDVGDAADNDNSATFTERKLEAYFDSPYGKLTIGQGDGAANGTSEFDLSGTSVIMYSGVNDTSGSFTLVDSGGNAITTIGKTRSNFDGLSRNDRILYDSPKLGPVKLSASTTNGNAWEVATRLSHEMDGIGKFAAAAGYVDTNDRTSGENPLDFRQIGVSASFLHTTGLNLTLAWGQRDPDNGEESNNYYTKVGYKRGNHAIAVEYGLTQDLELDGDDSENYGIAYVASPWKGVELYAAYRTYALERDGVNDIEDLNQVMVGARVKFW